LGTGIWEYDMEKRIFGENVHLYFIKLNGNADAASIVAALFR
jgi:hypothetical protein